MNMIATLLEEEFSGARASERLYADDVFSAYTYTGNGTTQTINNGIDLAGTGGVVMTFNRSGGTAPILMSTLLGKDSLLFTMNTDALLTVGGTFFSGFNSNGYSIASGNGKLNISGNKYVSFTFREAPKFFTQKLVSHSNGGPTTVDLSVLGTVGCVILKRLDAADSWYVFHRSLAGTPQYMLLNSNSPASNASAGWALGDTSFTISGSMLTGQYIILGFAHNIAADGLIQCGMAQGPMTPNLGWEAQYTLVRSTNTIDDWYLFDQARGYTVTDTARLRTNSAAPEDTVTGGLASPNASGFYYGGNGPNYTYIAIRRPNKPVTDASKVFCPVARTGTGVATSVTTPGFPADTIITSYRTYSPEYHDVVSRLRGGNKYLSTALSGPELTENIISFDVMSGYGLVGTAKNSSGYAIIDHAFRRAPGFFDEVCYTGNGATRSVAHNLGSAPGMMWIKRRDTGGFSWAVYHKSLGASQFLSLNGTWAVQSDTIYFGGVDPTATHFNPGTAPHTNVSGGTHTAILFGDTPGLCKAGSFVFSGADTDVILGFNPRLVIFKNIANGYSWYVADTARGIVAGNDPWLELNGTNAEVTTRDWVDPITNGFRFVNTATSTFDPGTFIYWACA